MSSSITQTMTVPQASPKQVTFTATYGGAISKSQKRGEGRILRETEHVMHLAARNAPPGADSSREAVDRCAERLHMGIEAKRLLVNSNADKRAERRLAARAQLGMM